MTTAVSIVCINTNIARTSGTFFFINLGALMGLATATIVAGPKALLPGRSPEHQAMTAMTPQGKFPTTNIIHCSWPLDWHGVLFRTLRTPA
jgi:hypothetical protein